MRPIMKVKYLEIYQKVLGLPSFEEVHSYEKSCMELSGIVFEKVLWE